MPSLTSAVAAAIRGRRAALDWTQDELADRLGWTQRVISRIERGQRELTLAEVARICRTLDVGLADLVAGGDPDDVAALRLR